MKIAIGCDHIVTEVKDEIAHWLTQQGHEVLDKGTYDKERTHYPIYGHLVGRAVALGEADFGICICGTGVGISNAAQKTKGVRTALIRDVNTVIKAKEEFNVNVLSFGGRIVGVGFIEECINEYLKTNYQATPEKELVIDFIDNIIKHENYDVEMFDDEKNKWINGYYHD